jgi:hypothetical protein
VAALFLTGSSTPVIGVLASGGSGGVADGNWGSGIVNVSLDGGSTYGPVGTVHQAANMGVLTAALATYGGTNPDTAHTLSVNLAESAGSLTSASTPASAAAGVALALVDGELIGPQTANLTGSFAYDLTNLYRGLLGTAPASHAIGAAFGRLDSSVFYYAVPAAYIGVTLYFKIQSVNIWGNATQDISACTAYPFTPTGAGYGGGAGGVPVAPAGLSATPGSNYALLSWSANPVSDNIQTYTVYRAPGIGASFGSAVAVATVAGSTFTDIGLSPSTGYTYFLKAQNTVGLSAASDAANLTTLASGVDDAAGFGFWTEGLFTANEHIGTASWPTDVKFTNSDPRTYLIALPGCAATSDSVFTFTDQALTVLGTITVPAGTRIGNAPAWTVDPYVHPADQPMLIFSPATADATLASVNAEISGTGT